MADTFVVYSDYKRKYSSLTNEQIGMLCRMVFDYNDGLAPDESADMVVNICFNAIKVDLDRNKAKYEETVRKRKEAGSKGGTAKAAKATKSKQSLANVANARFAYHNDNVNDNDNDNDNDNVNDNINVIVNAKTFIPPTAEEVRAYCSERNNNVDPQTFVDFYQGKGWMVGKNKMKDWKAAVRTWEKNRDNGKTNYSSKPNQFRQFPQREKSEMDYAELERRKLGGF